MRGFFENNEPVVLLIPALNPDEHLLQLVEKMFSCWRGPVLLVDDGSGSKAKEQIFPAAESMGCVVIHHASNRGKGRALKTGFQECLNRWPELIGVVTADADGQHLPEDIIACAARLKETPGSLVLGCRDFHDPNVPPKSMLGNRITRTFMRLFCGVSVTDTQTGLRGIPATFMSALLNTSGEGYDFETKMLLETKLCQVPIVEQPIQTVYLNQNRASHFHPFRDSLRIYKVLLKFCAASMAGFCADITLFALFSSIFFPLGTLTITAATVFARLLSASINYLINHTLVFHSRKRIRNSAVRYGVLCIAQMLTSALLVTIVHSITQVPAVGVKLIIDFLLFFVSFQIQKRWVF